MYRGNLPNFPLETQQQLSLTLKIEAQHPVKGLNAHKGKRFTGRLVFFQAKEMGINCLYRKQIQRGVPMPAHLINQ